MPISSQELTGQTSVSKAIEELKSNSEFIGKHYSDIVDEQRHQYVDLVMEGGGVLGIALAGYTYCLEQAGIRFLGVAGTSAGAINALLIAASDTPDREKSDTVVCQVANVPLSSFVDGNVLAKLIVYTAQWKVHWLPKLIVGLIPTLFELPVFLAKLGLNPGNKFQVWLMDCLSAVGIDSNNSLIERMTIPSSVKLRESRNEEGDDRPISSALAIIASDLTTRTKVEFPRMSQLYWHDPLNVNPAVFARASMSVPFFFQPFSVRDLPTTNQHKQAWTELAGYEGEIPRVVKFVDGGILSNFPIYVFHNYKFVPRAPTFGVRLGIERERPFLITNIVGMAKGIFRSTRHILDYEFISKNQEYKKLICQIDTGTHYWLNFKLSDEAKLDLFAKGVEAAAKFLLEFDWQEYKELRKRLLQKS